MFRFEGKVRARMFLNGNCFGIKGRRVRRIGLHLHFSSSPTLVSWEVFCDFFFFKSLPACFSRCVLFCLIILFDILILLGSMTCVSKKLINPVYWNQKWNISSNYLRDYYLQTGSLHYIWVFIIYVLQLSTGYVTNCKNNGPNGCGKGPGYLG